MNANKINILIENGSFNKNAASVNNPLFKSNSYFDPQDIVQVKYEMLRAVKNNELTVSAASKQFGFSRTAYYKIEKRFNEAGIGGLCLQKTGPKFPAKVTSDIIEFAEELKEKCPGITNDKIIKEIKDQKGITIHKRSLQRIQAKKNNLKEDETNYDYSQGICYYEEIHRHLIQCNVNNKAYRMGMELILQYGLKVFLNKFKRKESGPNHYDIPKESVEYNRSFESINGSSQELIVLLSEMIQATGNYHGTEQKNYN